MLTIKKDSLLTRLLTVYGKKGAPMNVKLIHLNHLL